MDAETDDEEQLTLAEASEVQLRHLGEVVPFCKLMKSGGAA